MYGTSPAALSLNEALSASIQRKTLTRLSKLQMEIFKDRPQEQVLII
jgi:hypothetical protein